MKNIGLVFVFLFFYLKAFAIPASTSKYIMVDQFGYFPTSKKIAVLADPQVGFSAADAFSPSIGTNQYQVRRWADDFVVFSGTIQPWNSGQTHAQSGDKGWTFDFSTLTTTGSYYIFDAGNNIGSGRFEISANVYDNVLKAALRVFYHQRLGTTKTATYAGVNWTDAASHQGAEQDLAARLYSSPTNSATARNLSGGWMDAGDANKYTTFAEDPVIQLVEAYRFNPSIFKDDYGIPESGNGVPDIIDELKFEIDFLKRMQDGTGTNGFLLKMGNIDYNQVHPLSTDQRPRYYVGECTSATLAGAAMFAVASQGFKNIPSLQSYATDLVTRAETAWARAKVTTSNFVFFESTCDDGTVKAGDADHGQPEQLASAFVAATYLFEATGKAEYKSYIETNYQNISRYNWLGPYDTPQHLALARLTKLPGISATIIANIKSKKAAMEYQNSVNDYTNKTDLYRAHLGDGDTNWGSNMTRSNAGNINLDFKNFGVNGANYTLHREIAEGYLHWLHGVNPFSMVMLSNMNSLGAERSVNEIYHGQWYDGTKWDNVQTSQFGPPAGYVTGGPNKFYAPESPLFDASTMPVQKCYVENNSSNYIYASWELTEPAIYYQAAYVSLLSRIMGENISTNDTQAPTTPTALVASNTTAENSLLKWNKSTDNLAVAGYDVYLNGVLKSSFVSDTTLLVEGLTCNTAYTFYVVARDNAGNTSANSNSVSITTAVCPAVSTNIIYDDALQSSWADWSWNSTRNMAGSQAGQIGTNSMAVQLADYGGLSLRSTEIIPTNLNPEIKFRIYATSTLPISVNIQSTEEGDEGQEFDFNTTPNQWKEVTIRMSDLGNPAGIKRINIRNPTESTLNFMLDQIRIETPIVTAGFKAKIKVILEGFVANGVMRTDLLTKNLMPKAQPFNKAPWNYTGTESVTTIPTGVSDWVLLVARRLDGSVLAKKAVFLKSDGSIVDIAQNAEVDMGTLSGDVYITVHQQAHLAVFSASTVQSGILYDFTISQNKAKGTSQQILVGSVWCMYGGDYDQNGLNNNLDFNKWKQNGATVNTYISVDGDGNGLVNNLDFNIWRRNRSKVGIVEIRTF